MTAISREEEEAIAHLRLEYRKSVEEGVAPVKREVDQIKSQMQAFGQRLSRPPGAVELPIVTTTPLLSTDNKFVDWLRSPRAKSHAYAGEFEFHIESKAGPLLNVGGTQHVGTGVTGPAQPTLRLVELLPVVPMRSGAAAEYAKETSFAPGAALQLEGAVKGETDLVVQNVLATIKSIATTLRVSTQSLSDTPGLGAWLDARLRYAVQLKAEDFLLNAALPDGLLANAGALTPGFDPGATGTALDQIASAIGQLASAGFSADGIVMSGADATKARLLKGSTGEYLWSSPDSATGIAGMCSVPVVISPSIAPGTWLVGAFAQSCLLFVRQLLTVEVSFQDQDNFVRNLATIRAEERIGVGVPVPAGLIKGIFPVSAPALANGKR